MDHHSPRSPSPTDTVSFYLEPGGQVFCLGNPEIGLGTTGLGEAATKSQQRFQREYMHTYWSGKVERMQEDKQKEQQRLSRLASQMKTGRERLAEAKEQREKEIHEMVLQRKAFEKEAEEKREAEQHIKNQIIHEEKEEALRQHNEAKKQREVQKDRELQAVRQERDELRAINAKEKQEADEAARCHIRSLMEWHKESRQKAKEEEKQRYIARCKEVERLRREQEERNKKKEMLGKALKSVKEDLIVSVKREVETRPRKALEKKEESAHVIAQSMRDETKDEEARRKKREKEIIAERQQIAAKQRQEAVERFNAYEEAKEKEKAKLQKEAKEQRRLAKEEQLREQEEKKAAHDAYIKDLKEIMSRKAEASPKRAVTVPLRPRKQKMVDGEE